jgi:hypothetical protein
MAKVKYTSTSPYYETKVDDAGYLGPAVNRRIPKQADDQLFTITETYKHRPDLLAFDLYDDASLWWVFAQRNPNSIIDPIYDFKPGIKIFLPKISTLKSALGF